MCLFYILFPAVSSDIEPWLAGPVGRGPGRLDCIMGRTWLLILYILTLILGFSYDHDNLVF